MQRWFAIVLLSLISFAWSSAPAVGSAEVAPIEDTGPDVMELDAGDTGEDAMGDLTEGDVADSDTVADASADADGTDDATVDADVPAGPLFRYYGTVDLADRSDDSATTVTLTQIDGSASDTATTGADGAFEITGLPPGEYRAEFSSDGYVGLTEEFRLDADRVISRTLYPDQSVQLELTIVFAGDESDVAAPSTVSPVLEGPRGRRMPDTPLAVENDEATWSVQDLGVGSWTLSVRADGFESASIPFDVAADGAAQRIRLELVPETIPGTEATGGCAAAVDGHPRSPMPWLVFCLGLGLLRMRRHRHD